MQTFNEKLQAAKKEFDGGAGYDKHAVPEVLAHCKAGKAENAKKYFYNRILADYIKERETIDKDMESYLYTEVYLAQHDIRNEEKAEHERGMVAAGWRKLDKAAVDDALTQGKRLEVNADSCYDWITSKITEVFKPYKKKNDIYYLMKPKATKKGIELYHFENAFCQLV
mgnify:CR=1 FL=1